METKIQIPPFLGQHKDFEGGNLQDLQNYISELDQDLEDDCFCSYEMKDNCLADFNKAEAILKSLTAKPVAD